jgi:hypothetical protein
MSQKLVFYNNFVLNSDSEPLADHNTVFVIIHKFDANDRKITIVKSRRVIGMPYYSLDPFQVPTFDPSTPDTSYSGTISDATTLATSIYAFSVVDTGSVTCTTDNAKFEIREVPPSEYL